MSAIFPTYFKTQETRLGRSESLKRENSPALKLSQQDISLTIKDIYKEVLKSNKRESK